MQVGTQVYASKYNKINSLCYAGRYLSTIPEAYVENYVENYASRYIFGAIYTIYYYILCNTMYYVYY